MIQILRMKKRQMWRKRNRITKRRRRIWGRKLREHLNQMMD